MCPKMETLSRLDDAELELPEGEALRSHIDVCARCAEVWGWFQGIRKGWGGVFQAVCPPAELMGEFVEGGVSDGAAREVRGHLEQCAECRDDLERLEMQETETGHGRLFRTASFRKAAGWAAAVFLSLGVGLWGWNAGSPPDGHPAPAYVQTGAVYQSREFMGLQMSDGGRIELSPGTELACLSLDSGGRTRFDLRRGEMFAEVPDGARQLEIRVPGGVIRDMGTVFRVRVWEAGLPWSPEARPVRFTVVETSRGAVELIGEVKTVRSIPRQSGVLVGDGVPFLMEREPAGQRPTFEDRMRGLKSALARNDTDGALRIWVLLLEEGHGEKVKKTFRPEREE